MKNFSTSKRVVAPVVPAFAMAAILLSSACERIEQDGTSPVKPATVESESPTCKDLSPENIVKMLSELPLTQEHIREVFDGVNSSAANGYDEEYTFACMFSDPGSGVGDELLQTRSVKTYSSTIRNLLSSVESSWSTRAESFTDALSASGLQIYWPYSEDWDGKSMPVITFNPEEASSVSRVGFKEGCNVGYLREELPGGLWIVREVIVDEEYAKNHPVWVINRNEDAAYLTPQMLEVLHPERSTAVATRSNSDCKSLVLKEFKAHRNYDSWFAGGSEFFVKCGSLDGFTAQTEEELKLFSPSVTDMMINVKRKYVGKTLRFNTMLVSEWTPQLEECVFLMIEDDGGKQTSWKASGVVKIKSKSYGFEVDLPFRRNDDLVWRGKLSSNYFKKNNGKPNRFGDVSITFSFL
ncbi:MAG TPA: hypothetical protein DIT75_03100 [Rikenellaceae bacterium]|nr:hypothetical protein [Rikenellaceae bacterium]